MPAAGPARTEARGRASGSVAADAVPCEPPRRTPGCPRPRGSFAQRAAGDREKDVLESHGNYFDMADRGTGRSRGIERRRNEISRGGAVRGDRQRSVRTLAPRDRCASREAVDHRSLVAVQGDLEMHDLLRADRPLQSRGGVQGDDAAVVDDRDAVAELVCLLHVMRREQDRPALCLELADPVAQVARSLGVEPDCRLVEYHERRIGQKRPRQRETLPHAGGVTLHIIVGAVGELHGGQDVRDARLRLARRHVVQRREVFEVLAAGELPVEAPFSGEHRAEPCAYFARPREGIDAEDADRAACRDEERGEHLHRRRLARAVRPEEAEDLTRLYNEIDPIHSTQAIALVRLSAYPLPDRPSAALEALDEVLRLNGSDGHSTKISTRSSSSAISTIFPGKSTVRSSSSRSMPNFPRCPRTRPLDASFIFPTLAMASGMATLTFCSPSSVTRMRRIRPLPPEPGAAVGGVGGVGGNGAKGGRGGRVVPSSTSPSARSRR